MTVTDGLQLAVMQSIAYSGIVGQVGIDRIEFVSITTKMKSAANSFAITAVKWPDYGENSKVFDVYLGQYAQLHTIMEKYQELVLKDIEAINSIRTQLEDMDDTLTSAWQ